jgi:hypothetical protein
MEEIAMRMPGFTADAATLGGSRQRYRMAPTRGAGTAAVVPARPCCFDDCELGVCSDDGFQSPECRHCLGICTPDC